MAETAKTYTLEEVSKQNGTNGTRTWIVVRDIVYDVTDYMEEHPGGGELIEEYAGQECTKAFNDAGHSSDAWKDLKKYKIGELVEEDKKANRSKKVEKKEGEENTSRGSILSVLTCGCLG